MKPMTGPAKARLRAPVRHPTWALVRTTLRGAVVGYLGLALLLFVWCFVFLAFSLDRRPIPAVEAFKLMAGAPFFSAMLAGISTALLASMWVLMRRQAVARLVPAAHLQLQRAMALCLLPLWAWMALPAVAAALRLAAAVPSAVPGAVPATWALVLYTAGLPALGMAVALGLVVLVRPTWLRTALGLLPMLVFVGLNQIGTAPLHALPGRDLWMAAAGLIGLAAAMWTAARSARSLSVPAAWQAAATTGPAGLGSWQRGGDVRTPPRRWHALLLPMVTATWRDAAVMVAGLALMLWWFQHSRMGWNLAVMLMLCLVANAAAPWTLGSWASPRLALLPGGLQRQRLAWLLWRHVMARGLPRVALAAGLLLATAVPLLRAPAEDVAATSLLCIACAWVVGSGVVAVLPWCKSSLALRMAPWAAMALFAVAPAALAWSSRSDGGMHLSTLAWACATAAISLPLGLLLVALSSWAWSRYDWSRMPATAPMMEMLLRQAAGRA